MKRQDCQQYQNLLMGGAQLQAGLVLKPEDQQALQGHLSSCTTCQALAQNLLSMDNLLRACLHDRWDAIPQPKRIAAKVVQAKMRRHNMSHAMKTMIGALAALALVAIIFFTTRQMTPAAVDHQKIIDHPELYLLRYEDMPENTAYYWQGSANNQTRPEIFRVTNSQLAWPVGQEAAEKLVADTERIDGWMITYQRRNADDPGIEAIDNWLTIHQTPQGAQKAVKENARVYWGDLTAPFPREPLGTLNNLGNTAYVWKYVNAVAPGFERTTYQVDFAYQTVSVRVQVTDLSSRVTLEDAVDLAQIVLSRLKE